MVQFSARKSELIGSMCAIIKPFALKQNALRNPAEIWNLLTEPWREEYAKNDDDGFNRIVSDLCIKLK
jgi:hypothetical protein